LSSHQSNEDSPWERSVPHFLHEVKVVIIEAMLWIEEPLSAKTIERIMDNGTTVSVIAYHMRTMARAGVVAKKRAQQVRGVTETFYVLAP